MMAGLVDSLCLSVAWTIIILEVTATHGLAAAGMCSAAMLVGVALSAPVAGWLARFLAGRHLLRGAAGVEAVLRLSVFLLLFGQAPVWALALCVSAMNVTAWTGYAGMRAEVAAASHGSTALTWYGTIVAAVEAVGVAVAALLPVTTGAHADTVLVVVLAAYVLALVPTVLVAGGSTIPRAPGKPTRPSFRRGPATRAPALGGALLMFTASAPTLLFVALAAPMHGRSSVGAAAVAFTLGSLAAPILATRMEVRGGNRPTGWILCSVGMVAGWTLAPVHVVALCLAQAMSGLFMTTLEGLLDTTAARRFPDQVTGALARATAGRALGSAGGTAVLPLVVAAAGLQSSLAAIAITLVLAGVLAQMLSTSRRTDRTSATGQKPAGRGATREAPAAGLASVAPLVRAAPHTDAAVLVIPRDSVS